jgi:hypothetical protein
MKNLLNVIAKKLNDAHSYISFLLYEDKRISGMGSMF